MRLEKYLSQNKLSTRAFSSLVGVTHAHIINIIAGKRSPSILLIKRIEEETGGKVTLNDLLHPEAPSRLKSRKKKNSEKIKA